MHCDSGKECSRSGSNQFLENFLDSDYCITIVPCLGSGGIEAFVRDKQLSNTGTSWSHDGLVITHFVVQFWGKIVVPTLAQK